MDISILLYIFVYAFGLCIGSFLNCAVYRLEHKKSLGGRSFCPHCKHTLNWKDLFPIFSFLLLKGKCRYCKKKISWQYPLVEAFTGLIFLFTYIFQFSGFNLFGLVSFGLLLSVYSLLIMIFVYDLKHYIIPDRLLFPAIILSLLYLILNQQLLILSYLLSSLIASGFFFCIFFFSRGQWMGFGDVKLAILMGILLGWPNTFAALFLAFFLGAVIGIALMILQKKGLKSEIPFGPFLITGTFISIFWGEKIVGWYLNFFA